MPTEAAIVWGAKVIGGSIVTYFVGLQAWITKQNHTKLQNTLSKQETLDLINLKLDPLQTRLDMKMDQVLSSSQANTSQSADIIPKLQELSENVAVVQTEVVNIKDRLDRQ